MDLEEVAAVILEYGLSIRQIPKVVVSTFTYNNEHLKDGEEVVEINGRKFLRRNKIPVNAGSWMCKQVNNTDSMVRWNLKTDNLAHSLGLSVKLFVDSIK